jgi:hypothetical protein
MRIAIPVRMGKIVISVFDVGKSVSAKKTPKLSRKTKVINPMAQK